MVLDRFPLSPADVRLTINGCLLCRQNPPVASVMNATIPRRRWRDGAAAAGAAAQPVMSGGAETHDGGNQQGDTPILYDDEQTAHQMMGHTAGGLLAGPQ